MSLAHKASALPWLVNHTQYYTWLPIRYVVCWAERDQRNIYQAPMRAKEKHKHTENDKEKGTGITKYTGQRKIDDGHSIERVCHSASREPSDTLPSSQPCTQKRVAFTTFVGACCWVVGGLSRTNNLGIFLFCCLSIAIILPLAPLYSCPNLSHHKD